MELDEELEKLNWHRNDAKIYIALLDKGTTTPQSLSEATGIDRTRVYDSLKRLMKKGYVKKEQKEWGGRYEAEAVEKVFNDEIANIKTQLSVASSLKDKLKEIEAREMEERLVWAIQDANEIRNTIKRFVAAAKSRVLWIMSPDLFVPKIEDWAFDILVAKSKKQPGIKIETSLQLTDENKVFVKKLLECGVRVYNRLEAMLPTSLLVVDDDKFIQLSISSFEKFAEYSFGFYGENVARTQIQGLEYMFYHLSKDMEELKTI